MTTFSQSCSSLISAWSNNNNKKHLLYIIPHGLFLLLAGPSQDNVSAANRESPEASNQQRAVVESSNSQLDEHSSAEPGRLQQLPQALQPRAIINPALPALSPAPAKLQTYLADVASQMPALR